MDRSKIIYLDNNATTIAVPEVVAAMQQMLEEYYGNPSSLHHFAAVAGEAVKGARQRLGTLLGCRAAELVFTSGATESIVTAFNSTLFGRAGAHVVATAVEHPAVLKQVEVWGAQGVDSTIIPVDGQGLFEMDALEAAIRTETALVAVMVANNETGVLFPVAAVAALCRERKVPLLLDASQAVGKVPLNVKALRPDYLALSAHKFHGPKGVGALYVRRGASYRPLIFGGGQEKERRSGTENVPGIVGMGVAAALAQRHLDQGAWEPVAAMRDEMERRILERLPQARVNGCSDPGARTPNTSNISFKHASGEAILQHLDELGIAASSSSACSSNEQEPSHVLRAMHTPESHIHGSVRIGLSLFTQQHEIDALLEHLPRVIELARAASPFVGSDVGADYVADPGADGGHLFCE